MTVLVNIALFGFIPFALAVFMLLPGRRAVIVSLITGWLFLPIAQFSVPGLPDFNKVSVISVAVVVASLLLDSKMLLSWRPRWYDVPMLVWCFSPMLSSIVNGLGPYDGLARVFSQMVMWGIPYWIGRVYFADIEGLRELAIGIVVGGLVYVPLCLFEIRMSPVLHSSLYGFHQHQFAQSKRFGGFRPVVFMQHGLAVGMWMTAATLICFWMYFTNDVKRLLKAPMLWLFLVLFGTAVMVKSTGALGLLIVSMGCLFVTRLLKTRVVFVLMMMVPVGYIATRGTGMWDGMEMVEFANATVGADRAQSIDFRLHYEDILAERAMEQPILGWGGWGRNRPEGQADAVTDGLWIIALGQFGLVGLAGLYGSQLVGPLMLVVKARGQAWRASIMAAPMALAILLTISCIDYLLNAMINPLFTVASGALPPVMSMMTVRRGPHQAQSS